MENNGGFGMMILETLFLGGLFYAVDRHATKRTLRLVENEKMDSEIEELKRQLEEMKKSKA